MLTVTSAQVELLSERLTERLIDDGVEHVRASLPEVFDRMGQAEVRESVRLALRKSGQYGLESWSDAVRYLTVMYILGFEFDDDPRYAWAPRILGDPELSADAKMDGVTDWALKESEAAHPPPAPE
jgi:hypothetical protein